MPVPLDFQFSQGCLQDYVDCPRLFQLRYLLRVAWPAVEAEPLLENERRRKMGELFHHLVHQSMLGVPLERLSRLAAGSRLGGTELETWWQNYLAFAGTMRKEGRSLQTLPEISLAGSLCGARLTAKYDALLLEGGPDDLSITILDWKTSRQRPRQDWLAGRLQTRVYLFLVVQAGAFLAGKKPLSPSQVEMVYWFAGFPNLPERFTYSAHQYDQDGVYLGDLIQGLQSAREEDFTACANPQTCRFCVYRSLCERGVEAGDLSKAGMEPAPPLEEPANETELDLDFDQIAEIEF
jgi:hypothetical protein